MNALSVTNEVKGQMGTVEKIEKTFEQRRLVFHLRNREVLTACGQTAGGWGDSGKSVSVLIEVLLQGRASENTVRG